MVVERINLDSAVAARRRMMLLPFIKVQVANHSLNSSILLIMVVVVFVRIIVSVFATAASSYSLSENPIRLEIPHSI